MFFIHPLIILLGTLCECWVHLCTENIISFSWHPFQVLVHVNMIASENCCRFVTLRQSHPITCQRGFIGYMSGDWEGHGRTHSAHCQSAFGWINCGIKG